MSIPSKQLNILTFPQSWDVGTQTLAVNILVLPTGDPFADFDPDFPDATLSFEAHITEGLQKLPTPVGGGPTLPIEQDAIERRKFFDELVGTFNQPEAGFQVRPHLATDVANKPAAVKKYLTSSYRTATRFSSPQTKLLVSDDSYECALKDGPLPEDPKIPPSRAFYWEEIFSFVLRQPLLAIKLGLIYRSRIVFDAANPNRYGKGGYLHADLAAGSDYFALSRQCFAARIPPLKNVRRQVFAPVLFPVNLPDNYDQVFPEVDLYDDGFAKVVHGAQPARAAVLETSKSDLPAPKDVGIRLAWDDEQLAIWLNRQLGINAIEPSQDPPPAPLGVAGYRVDVWNEQAQDWHSLMTVQADLKLNNLVIGNFNDELSVEVLPVNFDNKPNGEFWLPSYFTSWAGSSLAVVDRTPFEIAGATHKVTPEIYKPVNDRAVPLRYGGDYKFRVRLMDLTGGGPTPGDDPLHPSPTGEVTVPFRRFVPPKAVSIEPGSGVAANGRTATFKIRRPDILYPDVLFTDKYPDPIALLMAQSVTAEQDEREPALPDLDVTHLRVEVQVRTLSGDPKATADIGQPFVPVYSTIRTFHSDPLEVNFEFTDMPSLTQLTGATFPDNTPLPLPTARAVRLVFTALGSEDENLDYWGSQEARVGAVATDAYVHVPSTSELDLFQAQVTPEIQAIFLQPDPVSNANTRFQMEGAGLRHEAPSDLVHRLAHQLDLPVKDITFSSHAGRRTVFGCSRALRHVLNPDNSAISFSSKADLTQQWIVVLRLTLDRDWSWYAPGHVASMIKEIGDPVDPAKKKLVFPPEPLVFEVERKEGNGSFAPVGRIILPGNINPLAAQDPDRNHTDLIFFDGFDPKPVTGQKPVTDQPLTEPVLVYRLKPIFRDNIASVESREWTLRLPITTPPSQVPKIVSAGLAFSDYAHRDRYSRTEERRRMLFLEFDAAVTDKQDRYFGRVLAYGPDPMMHSTKFKSPEEPPLPIDEPIRVVTVNQSADCAGINAMQELIPPPPTSDRQYYLLPLPPGLDPESPELFGFFVYELRVGHDCSRWTTAKGRFGHPLRMTGVQHPAPQLRCAVTRDERKVTVAAPYATPVWQGENIRPPDPKTTLQGLLYAQVMQADALAWRNVLLLTKVARISLQQPPVDHTFDPRLTLGRLEFGQGQIVDTLRMLGLPLHSKLSVVMVELLPEPDSPFADPLGKHLGEVRILRTTPLTPVPEICAPVG